MTIIKKKGKWQFGYKDTYSLDSSLGPIIHAGLKKFHDVLESRSNLGKTIGIPSEYMRNEAEWITDNDVQDWLNDLKKMMYAFYDKEPDIRDYNFKMRINPGDRSPQIICTNEEEAARYKEAAQLHQEKVQEGLALFALRYKDLWW